MKIRELNHNKKVKESRQLTTNINSSSNLVKLGKINILVQLIKTSQLEHLLHNKVTVTTNSHNVLKWIVKINSSTVWEQTVVNELRLRCMPHLVEKQA